MIIVACLEDTFALYQDDIDVKQCVIIKYPLSKYQICTIPQTIAMIQSNKGN